MKKCNYIIVLFSMVLLACSCIKTDFGDYDYDRVPELQFDEQLADNYLLNINDSLQLAIDMQDLGLMEDEFTYRWYYYSANPPTDGVTPIIELGASTRLNLIGDMPTGQYFFVFEATNRETAITYFKRMTLNVQRFTSEGYLLLTSSTSGQPNLSIVTSGNAVYRDFLPTSVEFPITGNPREIISINSPNVRDQTIAIRTDAPQLYFMDYNTFEIQATANSLFSGGNNAQFDFFASDWWAMSSYLRDTEGNFYWSSRKDDRGLPEFNDAMLGGLSLAPLLIPTSDMFPIQVAFYDVDSKRFVYQFQSTNEVSPFQFSAEQIPEDIPFDINSFTDEIVFAGAGAGSQYVVGRNAQGNYSLYGLAIDRLNRIVYPSASVVSFSSPAQEELRFFSLSGVRPIMYYVAGNDLYMYRMNEQTHTLLYSFPETETIVASEVFREPVVITANLDYFPAMENRICVATNEGEEGFFYTFDLLPTGIIVSGTYSARYDGFDSIVDITYKMLK